MALYNILAIALALAMDAFAVSIAAGISLKKTTFRQRFRLAWHFGFFQAAMPVLGWSFGLTIHNWIEKYDHWAAFLLLSFVGVNMIRESFGEDKAEADKKDPTKGSSLVMLSVATSIDALAVGLSLAMIKVSIWTPALIIGLVAGALTFSGMVMGEKLGSARRFSTYAERTGGLVLLVIGLKILHEHGALVFRP
ncbi:MAG: manganese efflux pump [Desulfobacteraceae bacterium]|nr:manganese efflux pump [Desulfobacteraceae bacterium]MBU4053835.1 manganese efflux pump MntP family protein [Pseudomonadota bacterium]